MLWRPVGGPQDLCRTCKQEYIRFVLKVLMENTGALNDNAVNSIIELFRDRDIRVKEVKG